MLSFFVFVLVNSVCLLDKQQGTCKAHFKLWYFNKVTKKCEQFVYGGCQGNGNRFGSELECRQTCRPEGTFLFFRVSLRDESNGLKQICRRAKMSLYQEKHYNIIIFLLSFADVADPLSLSRTAQQWQKAKKFEQHRDIVKHLRRRAGDHCYP